MQIESLKVFCDLAETESFTKAAQINSVTQSAVSQTISALERQFNSLLIERSKKNFRLTPEGGVLYEHCKKILQTYDSLRSRLQEIEGVVSGSIRVATIYSIGLHVLPPYVTKFLKTFPTVNVQVEYRRANEVVEDVATNVVDLGLVAYPSRDSRLEIVPLRKDRMVLITAPDHPLAKEQSLKIKSLSGVKFISFERDIPTRKALDKILKDQGVSVEHTREFDNIETLKAVVALDSGVAIVPEETVKKEVSNHTLAAVPLEGKYVRELGIIYKKNKVLSPAIKQFIALLKTPL